MTITCCDKVTLSTNDNIFLLSFFIEWGPIVKVWNAIRWAGCVQGGSKSHKAPINERKIEIGSWLRCRENKVVYHHSGQGTTDYTWIIRILQSTTIDYDNDFREELELGCIEGKSNMDVEAQVMSRNSMASGLPLKKFLISGPSSSMKKQDLGNILITNPVSNQRAHEEFQIRNHMLAAVSESDGFSDLLWKSVIGY